MFSEEQKQEYETQVQNSKTPALAHATDPAVRDDIEGKEEGDQTMPKINDAEYAKKTLQKLQRKMDTKKPSIGQRANLFSKESQKQYEEWKGKNDRLKQLETEANAPTANTLQSQLASVEAMFELTAEIEKTANEMQEGKPRTASELVAYENKQTQLSSHVKIYPDIGKRIATILYDTDYAEYARTYTKAQTIAETGIARKRQNQKQLPDKEHQFSALKDEIALTTEQLNRSGNSLRFITAEHIQEIRTKLQESSSLLADIDAVTDFDRLVSCASNSASNFSPQLVSAPTSAGEILTRENINEAKKALEVLEKRQLLSLEDPREFHGLGEKLRDAIKECEDLRQACKQQRDAIVSGAFERVLNVRKRGTLRILIKK